MQRFKRTRAREKEEILSGSLGECAAGVSMQRRLIRECRGTHNTNGCHWKLQSHFTKALLVPGGVQPDALLQCGVRHAGRLGCLPEKVCDMEVFLKSCWGDPASF